MESFSYDDDIVRKFATATLFWGLVGTLAGLIVALLLVLPKLFDGLEWLSFGRLRPAAHQRRDLCLCGQRDFRGGLLQHPAAVQSSDVERCLEPTALLGLAADHRRRGGDAAVGDHPEQRVRRA